MKILFTAFIGILILTLGCNMIYCNKNNVEIYVKQKEHGKGYFATCEVILKNQDKNPKWFLILSPNHNLGSNILKSNLDGTELFSVIKYTNKEDKAFIIEHLGNDYFRGVRIPGNGIVCFENFDIYSPNHIKTLEIIETSTLKLNNKTTLIKWLPFNCTSDSNVTISERTSSGKG